LDPSDRRLQQAGRLRPFGPHPRLSDGVAARGAHISHSGAQLTHHAAKGVMADEKLLARQSDGFTDRFSYSYHIAVDLRKR
jgi:hypothetical protein